MQNMPRQYADARLQDGQFYMARPGSMEPTEGEKGRVG